MTFAGFQGIDWDRWLPEATTVYAEKVVLHLAKEHKIKDPSQIEELRRSLCSSGAVYLQANADSAKFQRWQQVKHQFSQIARGAARLRELISNLDEEAAELFWRDENSLRDLYFLEKGSLGHSVRHIPTAGGGTAKIHLRQPDHLESLAIINTYAKRAGDRVPKQFGGHPLNFALRNWTGNMWLFWTQCLHRKFGFTPFKSPALRFCIDAMKPLDPSLTEASIETAVRDTRTHRGIIRVPAERKSKNLV